MRAKGENDAKYKRLASHTIAAMMIAVQVKASILGTKEAEYLGYGILKAAWEWSVDI